MRLFLHLKSGVRLMQYQSSMTMRKLKSHKQPSPTVGRFPTSIPASWIPQNCHRCSELSMSEFHYFCLASTLAISNWGSLPMLLGGFLVGPSKKRLRQDEFDTDSDSEGLCIDGNLEFNLGRSPWLPSSHSPQTDAAVVERRWKGKERLVWESSRHDSRLSVL